MWLGGAVEQQRVTLPSGKSATYYYDVDEKGGRRRVSKVEAERLLATAPGSPKPSAPRSAHPPSSPLSPKPSSPLSQPPPVTARSSKAKVTGKSPAADVQRKRGSSPLTNLTSDMLRQLIRREIASLGLLNRHRHGKRHRHNFHKQRPPREGAS
jgi:hypothetical protein